MRDAKTRIFQKPDTEEGEKKVKFHFQGMYFK